MDVSRVNTRKGGFLAVITAAVVLGFVAMLTPTSAMAAATSGSITFQAADMGSYDQFVVTFPEATAPTLSASDSDSGPLWAGSGKPVSMPGNHFIYLTGSGQNDSLAHATSYSVVTNGNQIIVDVSHLP